MGTVALILIIMSWSWVMTMAKVVFLKVCVSIDEIIWSIDMTLVIVEGVFTTSSRLSLMTLGESTLITITHLHWLPSQQHSSEPQSWWRTVWQHWRRVWRSWRTSWWRSWWICRCFSQWLLSVTEAAEGRVKMELTCLLLGFVMPEHERGKLRSSQLYK